MSRCHVATLSRICIFCSVFLASCGDPKDQNLSSWRKSPESIKERFVNTYFAKDPIYVKKCIDRMATLPDTDKVMVMDAGESCLTGLEIRERNALATAKKNAKSKK